jgi:hypothetical protein
MLLFQQTHYDPKSISLRRRRDMIPARSPCPTMQPNRRNSKSHQIWHSPQEPSCNQNRIWGWWTGVAADGGHNVLRAVAEAVSLVRRPPMFGKAFLWHIVVQAAGVGMAYWRVDGAPGNVGDDGAKRGLSTRAQGERERPISDGAMEAIAGVRSRPHTGMRPGAGQAWGWARDPGQLLSYWRGVRNFRKVEGRTNESGPFDVREGTV